MLRNYGGTQLLEETHFDEQWSIIDNTDRDILMITSSAISITKVNGSNYNYWSGEMAHDLELNQSYGIVTGEDERPMNLVWQDATEVEKLTLCAAVNDWVKQHGTSRLTDTLEMERLLRASYMLRESADSVQVKVEVRSVSE